VCGSAFSGKNTLCKILINYAIKSNWKPIFVDLDNHLNEIGTPGCIGAAILKNWFPV
jgi:polyribonucleotide 5'-hydroxyl-kinase